MPDGIEEQVIVLLKLVRGLTLTATNVLQSRSESPARPSETAVPKELKQLQLESAYETGMVTPMETAAPTEEKLQAHLRAAEQTIERLNRRLAERTEQLKVLHEFVIEQLPNSANNKQGLNELITT